MDIRKEFQKFFSALTNAQVILAYENGPRPALPYIMLHVDLANPLSAHISRIQPDGKRNIHAYRNARLQLQCYGPGSWEIMEALSMAIHTEAANTLASAKNIAINGQAQLQNIPVLRSATEYEPRAVLDIDAAYTGAITETVDYFDEVHGISDFSLKNTPQDPQPFMAKTEY